MKRTQHSESVEVEVTQLLRKMLVPTLAFNGWHDYVMSDIEPNAYSSREDFIKVYAYRSLLRKWKGFDIGIDLSSVSLRTWMKSELKCFSTNRRLEYETSTGNFSVAPGAIVAAQRKVDRILGPVNIKAISELCRFGNGATFDLRRGSTHAEKYRRPSITFDAIPVACQILSGDRYIGSLVGPLRSLKIVDSNRMVMVPKSAKTNRPIAAEPTLNSYIQQGIGRYIRSRLLRSCVDLNDQTINQDLASKALVDGLSTIDLSSASDTLCTNLVKLLLPREWYELLYSVRSPKTQYEGRKYLLSKFSSMGNAYTFELESLIFYALCTAVSENSVSVYGDDIVVSHQDDAPVRKILSWAGFDVNHDKSFGEGSRFFESCGKHYFDGVEVTPCYQKDVCTRPHDYVCFHNRLVRAGIRLNLRLEFGAAASLVRERCRQQFGRDCPGVGPLVEYDEYFVREDYSWSSPLADSVIIKSSLVINKVSSRNLRWQQVAYYGRKLRSPGFLNPDPHGQVSENSGSKLVVSSKRHWRSASQR